MTPTLTPEAALERLFTAQPIQADWFAPTFLAQVPLAQIESVVADLRTNLGHYQAVQTAGHGYRVQFERGAVPTQIVLDLRGRISGLLFRASAISLNEAVEGLRALPGQVSLIVLENQTERVALNADQPLAVGSAFKLAVLNALKAQIQAGQRSWQEVVTLQASWKSLPSGSLQNWPDASPLTLHTLAALMISQSDNTATDALIHLVGREAVEALAPRNRPFLTTREAFILKATANQALLQRYRQGQEADRRALLDELSSVPLPEADDFAPDPTALDIEWFFSTRELCRLIESLAELPLISIEPGPTNPRNWAQVAYKGGSEPGVLNLTTQLQAKRGKTYCVAATWNHTETLDTARFASLYSGLIEGLQEA